MFSKAGTYPPSGMFSWGHLILLVFFGILGAIFFVLSRNWSKEKVIRFFKYFSITLVVLEVIKIIWNIMTYDISEMLLNRFIPLYYCSIFLYAFVFIAFNRGKLAEYSHIWMVYGGLIAGVSFLAYPSSSLLEYPFFHFLSIHSIFFHTSLVFISLMIIRHKLYTPSFKDYFKFIIYSFVFMGLALIINKAFDLNMMFLEEPIGIGVFIWLNQASPILFQIIMFLAQLLLPFLFTHVFFVLITKFTKIKIYQ